MAKTIASKITGALAGISMLFAGAIGAAAQDESTPDSIEPVTMTMEELVDQEPWIQASRWAKTNPDKLAVYVAIGSNQNASDEEFQAFVEEGIENNFGIDTEVWVERRAEPVTQIQLFLNDIATDPTPIENIAAEITSVLEINQAASEAPETPAAG